MLDRQRIKKNGLILQRAKEEIKAKCGSTPSHTTYQHIELIMRAMETGDWEEVKNCSLYVLHGGEYCELLSVMHRLYVPNREELQ